MLLRIHLAYLNLSLLVLLGQKVFFSSATVVVNPKDTAVNEGESASLFCQFSVPPKTTSKCSWTKDNTLIDIDAYLGVYEWIGDFKSGNCSLRIVGTSNDRDDGTWVCQLPATSVQQEGDKSSPARLSVYVTPTSPVIYFEEQAMKTNSNISVYENMTASIYCVSRYGNPVAQLTWNMDNKNVYADEDRTVIEEDKKKTYKRTIGIKRSFTKEDNGKMLYCNLNHLTLNETISTEVRIDVHYDTTKVDVLSPNYVIVDAGSGYTFICKADGNPPADYEWLYKQSEAQNWEIKSRTSEYNIASAAQENIGEYMCLAGNKAMEPSSVITFELRNTTKNVVAIIGGVFGALLMIAVVILIIVVIKLRTKVRDTAPCKPELPNLEALNRASSKGGFNSRISKLGFGLRASKRVYEPRATTYMIPVPTSEQASLNQPPAIPRHPLPSTRSVESHIYAEPLIYDNVFPPDDKGGEYICIDEDPTSSEI